MILILSCDGDFSTDIVIDWLCYYQVAYIRINSFDFLNSPFLYEIQKDGTYTLKIGGENIDTKLVNVIWFRKFGFFRSSVQYNDIEKLVDSYTVSHLSAEFTKILDAFIYIFKDKYWLTNPKYIYLNKTNVLHDAQECGFNIPRTILTNSKSYLMELMKDKRLISKSVLDQFVARLGKDKHMMYTTEINNDDIENLPDMFLPSLVQELVEKKMEIRSFYIEGKCFSMAILSQKDPQTQLDFRKYNFEKPNRFIPYQLSIAQEESVDRLMKKIGLNCGSLDFIVTQDDSLVFLEINPTGQFGMVDFPCNYGLHQNIAETLIKHDGKIIQK